MDDVKSKMSYCDCGYMIEMPKKNNVKMVRKLGNNNNEVYKLSFTNRRIKKRLGGVS